MQILSTDNGSRIDFADMARKFFLWALESQFLPLKYNILELYYVQAGRVHAYSAVHNPSDSLYEKVLEGKFCVLNPLITGTQSPWDNKRCPHAFDLR
jgi:hypothetical protein